jgi:hypothetical protein
MVICVQFGCATEFATRFVRLIDSFDYAIKPWFRAFSSVEEDALLIE